MKNKVSSFTEYEKQANWKSQRTCLDKRVRNPGIIRNVSYVKFKQVPQLEDTATAQARST